MGSDGWAVTVMGLGIILDVGFVGAGLVQTVPENVTCVTGVMGVGVGDREERGRNGDQ